MGRKRTLRWSIRLASFFTSVAVLALSGVAGQEEQAQHQQSTCQRPRAQTRFLMLVSTMDGQVAALNIAEEGRLEWTIDAGAAPLLSSSIDKLEIRRNGVLTRLIPSLDGGIFQFDGDNIEAMPFTADTLLSASFKFSDDSVVVGGKESMTYGVDLNSGEVLYVCSMNGCNRQKGDSVGENGDVLVISRQTKTVRAIEMRTGSERWNFSVGHHEVAFIESAEEEEMLHLTEGQFDASLEDEDGYVSDCDEPEDSGFSFELPKWLFEEGSNNLKSDVQFKVLVPNGLVLAVDANQPSRVLWQHQFSSPIANAWTLQDGKLGKVDLFDDHHVPALGMGENEEESESGEEEEMDDQPVLYIGLHENQLYVQPSVLLSEEVCKAASVPGTGNSEVVALDMPRVRWQPYIATAPSRTPAITGIKNPLQITWNGQGEEHETAVATWQEQYPFDGGYYLYRDTSPYRRYPVGMPHNKTRDKDFIYGGDITMSLWIYWREIVLIAFVTALVVHWLTIGIIRARLGRMPLDRNTSQHVMSTLPLHICSTDMPFNCIGDSKESENEWSKTAEEVPALHTSNSQEYMSRYCEDFTQVTCLGKGGFGVVFEARNRMDDCSYAIKRIALNDSSRAREKVMREVKALAKLDHTGIVRYYQAWFECPPQGWQEERDRQVEELSMTPSVGYTTDLSPSPKPSSALQSEIGIKHNQGDTQSSHPLNPFGSHLNYNPLKPFGGMEVLNSVSAEWSESIEKKKGSTGGFVPGEVDDTEESGSYSFGVGSPGRLNEISESVDDLLQNSEASHSQPEDNQKLVPFNVYKNKIGVSSDSYNDSFSVVFEDSGCGEKSSNEELFTTEDHPKGKKGGNSSIISSEHSSSSSLNDHPPELEKQTLEDSTSDSPKESTSSGVVVDFFLDSPNLEQDPSSPRLSQSSTSEKTDNSHAVSTPHSISSVVSDHRSSRPKQLNLESASPKPSAITKQPLPTPKLYLYIQMQLCRRQSLKEWMASNTLSRNHQEVLDIFDQITSAVEYVHEHNLVHRDLKPSNIFFSMDGSIKVGDFGLVTPIEECDSVGQVELSSGEEDRRHTAQVGTKLYMSPEQAAGKYYCSKVDIFALGLILFELFYPFATQMERVKTLLDVRKRTFPARFARELPNVCEFVEQLLNEDPDQRPTAKDILSSCLLHEFNIARQVSTRIRSRTRTTSSSSSDSLTRSTSMSKSQ